MHVVTIAGAQAGTKVMLLIAMVVPFIPTTATEKGLFKEAVIVPLPKVPVVKLMLLAMAPIGKARAKSANDITRLMLTTPANGLPPICNQKTTS